MELTFTVTGRRCDLALHPVSEKTVERIKDLGRLFYAKKYIHWWRKGNTSTCGMKIDDECKITLSLDGTPVDFDPAPLTDAAVVLRRRDYLDSRVRNLALLGYDDEYCHMLWRWKNVKAVDPAKFEFFVQRWDRFVGEQDFFILDEVRYAGAFADVQDWGGSCGFTLVDPQVINLDEVRREMGLEAPEGKPAQASKRHSFARAQAANA